MSISAKKVILAAHKKQIKFFARSSSASSDSAINVESDDSNNKTVVRVMSNCAKAIMAKKNAEDNKMHMQHSTCASTKITNGSGDSLDTDLIIVDKISPESLAVAVAKAMKTSDMSDASGGHM